MLKNWTLLGAMYHLFKKIQLECTEAKYLMLHRTFVILNYLCPCGQSLSDVQALYFHSRGPVLPTLPPDGGGRTCEDPFCLEVCIDAYPAALKRRTDTLSPLVVSTHMKTTLAIRSMWNTSDCPTCYDRADYASHESMHNILVSFCTIGTSN